MTAEIAALLLGILAVLYAFNTTYLIRKMKKEDLEAEKRHQEILAEWRKEHEEWRREHEEMLERMDRRHEETMNRIAQLITAKSEEIKELIKT